MTYKLSEIISPAFSEPHRMLKSGDINQLVLKGGRGSGKSSYVSVEVPLLIIKNPQVHAVVMRKYASELRTSVYAQYKWAIGELGLTNLFKFTVSPMEITYKKTGQKIYFMGSDDPGKLKSLKVPFGYFGILHFEELDQFAGAEEIRSIEQSVLRGGNIAYEFKTFNPPITRDNWANRYCSVDKQGQLIHHSTYLTTPKDWLGERFINDAEYLKEISPIAYEHEYMGEPTGSGGNVFDNITIRDITDNEISSFDRIYHGLDWGWYPDPTAYIKCYYNTAQRRLYIFDEFRRNKTNSRGIYELLLKHGVTNKDVLICDSADNKSIADLVEYGIYARGAEKGPGSVNYSMKWLQGLVEIVIDGNRCPETRDEFLYYEYEKDKQGNVITGYPDKMNHSIDSVRYALNMVWRQRGK